MSSDTTSENVTPVLRRVQFVGIGVALVGAILAAMTIRDMRGFYASFFFAFVFWTGLSLGATTLTFLHHTIRATWGLAILRIIEAANKNLWLILLLWGVIVYGLVTHQVYQWGNPELVAQSEMLQKKQYWLNPMGFIIRGVFCFVFWIGLTTWFNKTSLEQDKTKNNALAQLRTNFAAPLGVAHVVVLTLAFTDWFMSLDPGWFSTIYGALFMIAHVISILSVGILIVLGLRKYRPFSEIVHKQITRDLGTVLLGFTMFWTYFTLSQWLIIWSGNLPEEIPFYINRFAGGMSLVGGAIILLQFFTPFTALLSVRLKRDPKLLLPVVILVIGIRVVDAWWQLIPFFRIGGDALNPVKIAGDLGVWAVVGGIWVWFFMGNLIRFAQQDALIVRHDLRLHEGKIAEAAHA